MAHSHVEARPVDAVAVRIIWITLFALLTGAGALIRIPLPFTPVPITLQTAFVISSGIVLGRDGIYAMALYLLLGGIGLPIFAGGEFSFPYLFGATGGYLIGFVAAAAVAGQWIRPNWASLPYFSRAWRLLAVSALVFIPGVLQLSFVAGISLSKAFVLGCLPFLIGDVLKVGAVAALPARSLRR